MYASYESVKNKKGLKIENNNKIIKIIRPLQSNSVAQASEKTQRQLRLTTQHLNFCKTVLKD